MKTFLLAILAAVALTGCESDKKYLITYEAQTKDGQLIRSTTIMSGPDGLTEESLRRLLGALYTNPRVSTNGIVVLAAVLLDK